MVIPSKTKLVSGVLIVLLIGFALWYRYYQQNLPTPAQIPQVYTATGNMLAGNPNGTITIVEFFDYRCTYCRKDKAVITDLLASNPNIRFVYKGYPLFGKASRLFLQAAIAADQQGKFLDFYRILMSLPYSTSLSEILAIARVQNLNVAKFARDLDSADTNAIIDQTAALVAEIKTGGAPVFYFAQTKILDNPNAGLLQKKYLGYMTLTQMQKYVDAVTTGNH